MGIESTRLAVPARAIPMRSQSGAEITGPGKDPDIQGPLSDHLNPKAEPGRPDLFQYLEHRAYLGE